MVMMHMAVTMTVAVTLLMTVGVAVLTVIAAHWPMLVSASAHVWARP